MYKGWFTIGVPDMNKVLVEIGEDRKALTILEARMTESTERYGVNWDTPRRCELKVIPEEQEKA